MGLIWFRQAMAWYDKHVEWLPNNQKIKINNNYNTNRSFAFAA